MNPYRINIVAIPMRVQSLDFGVLQEDSVPAPDPILISELLNLERA